MIQDLPNLRLGFSARFFIRLTVLLDSRSREFIFCFSTMGESPLQVSWLRRSLYVPSHSPKTQHSVDCCLSGRFRFRNRSVVIVVFVFRHCLPSFLPLFLCSFLPMPFLPGVVFVQFLFTICLIMFDCCVIACFCLTCRHFPPRQPPSSSFLPSCRFAPLPHFLVV